MQFDPTPISNKNCENLIGSVEIPVGVVGPLTIHGIYLEKPVYVPLATTEGALVASTNRGMKAMQQAGGANTIVINHGMSRAPVFRCKDAQTAHNLQTWIQQHWKEIASAAETTSAHLQLTNFHSWIIGRHLYTRFTAKTGEAMGMNMLSIALNAMIQSIILPQWNNKAELISLSSNLCTDKKENGINHVLGRGYWAQAEVIIPTQLVEEILKTSPEEIVRVHVQKNLVGSAIAGSPSQNAHVANIVAAMFLATGQDPAHIVEGAFAYTSMEEDDNGLYAAVTIPNLNIGTIGGGTYLDKFTEARKLISENLTPTQLAGVIAATALAGELSLIAALSTNTLACAHQALGRMTEQ